MYGYFRPSSSRLTQAERRIFYAYYCRVCYCLRKLGGQPARFFVTYDMAVYSLILNLAQKRAQPRFHRCEKLGTRVMHEYDNDEIGLRLANMSIIVFGEKIRDDKLDGNYLRAGGMNALFSRTVKQACAAEGELARIAREGTDRINEMQDNHAPVKDIFAVYGNMLADMFRTIDPELDERYLRLFRSIAVWTFYIDMLYDYDKDYKNKAYNGFHVEGVPTMKACFDREYMRFLNINREITDEMREALHAVADDSDEWRILFKIIDTALGFTIFPLLSTRQERTEMYLKFARDNVCFRLPVHSNFR